MESCSTSLRSSGDGNTVGCSASGEGLVVLFSSSLSGLELDGDGSLGCVYMNGEVLGPGVACGRSSTVTRSGSMCSGCSGSEGCQ